MQKTTDTANLSLNQVNHNPKNTLGKTSADVAASVSINNILTATNETSSVSFMNFCKLFQAEGAANLKDFFFP